LNFLKGIIYSQDIDKGQERERVCTEGKCGTNITDPIAFDNEMQWAFHNVVDVLEGENMEFWPIGGTLLAALRYGRIAGQLGPIGNGDTDGVSVNAVDDGNALNDVNNSTEAATETAETATGTALPFNIAAPSSPPHDPSRKTDVMDDDLEFMIGINEDEDWSDVANVLTVKLMNKGFEFCHNAFVWLQCGRLINES